jgi:hypothetical protein
MYKWMHWLNNTYNLLSMHPDISQFLVNHGNSGLKAKKCEEGAPYWESKKEVKDGTNLLIDWKAIAWDCNERYHKSQTCIHFKTCVRYVWSGEVYEEMEAVAGGQMPKMRGTRGFSTRLGLKR